MHSLGASPGREIKSPRRIGIDGESIRSIGTRGQTNWLPVFGGIGRAINRTVSVVAHAAVFRTPRQYDVQCSIRASSQSPGERLILSDSLILQCPGLAAVRALEDAAP